MARLIRRLWSAYDTELLRKYPLQTQICTSTVLWGLGDVLSQKIEGRPKWNPTQTAYAAAFGGALLGPLGHVWYGFLDQSVAKYIARGTLPFILSKVAVDEAVFGPLHVLGFFTFMTKAEGGSWKDVEEKIKRDFLSTYLAELAIWPAFQTFNFAKVPVRHQLLFVNSASLMDATFLCWVKNQDDWLATLGFREAASKAESSMKSS